MKRIIPSIVAGIFLTLMLLHGGGCRSGTDMGETAIPFFWGFAIEGLPDASRMERLVCKTTVNPAMVVFFLQWPAPGSQQQSVFPDASLSAIWGHGAIPVLTWEPFYHESGGAEHMISATAICSGAYDDYIVRFADAARAYGRPFFLRFAHEMNLSRYHWGGPADAYGPDSPADYVRMFRYVADMVTARGADNIRWVFCPNAESVPDADWNRIAAYYPGSEYVDVVGMDGYNWGTSRSLSEHGWESQWQPFQSIFQTAYHELRAIAPEKPLFVFETGSVTHGGNREEWIEAMFATLNTWDVQSVCWFQADKENQWRLSLPRDAAALQTIRRHIAPARQWLDQQ